MYLLGLSGLIPTDKRKLFLKCLKKSILVLKRLGKVSSRWGDVARDDPIVRDYLVSMDLDSD